MRAHHTDLVSSGILIAVRNFWNDHCEGNKESFNLPVLEAWDKLVRVVTILVGFYKKPF